VGYNRRGVGKGGSRVSGCSRDFWGAGAVLGKPNSLSATRNVMKRFAAKRLNEWVCFLHDSHHAHIVLHFGYDRPNKGIRVPNILPKMANISVSGVLRPNYCGVAYLLLRMDAHSAVSC